MEPSSPLATQPKGLAPALAFVTIRHPDDLRNRRNRRKVRQHVMKDIGLSRRKRKSPQHVPVLIEPMGPQSGGSQEQHDRSRICLPPAPSTDLMLYSRVEMRAQKMKSFLLREKSPLFVKVRELCFTLALGDDSAFHFVLAETALGEHHQAGEHLSQAENLVAMRHYNISLRMVHEHIRLSQATTNTVCRGVIIVVIGFASYDLSIGCTDRWEMHMAGLEAMVRDRGGLHTLDSSYMLQSLLWADVAGCLSLDRPPRFAVVLDAFRPTLPSPTSPALGRTLKSLGHLSPQLSEMCLVLESLAGVAEASEDGLTELFCMTLARCAYLLLSAPRIRSADREGHLSPLASLVYEATRLAVLLFLLRVAACTPRSVDLVPHGSRLSELLRKQDRRWDGLEELHLWVLIVAAVAEGQDTGWLAVRISLLMLELKLDWRAAKTALNQIAWVGGVFDEQMAKLEAVLDS